MNRTFGRRPSVQYLDITDADTMAKTGYSEEVIAGLGHVLSVNGFAISSNFVVNLTIKIHGEGGMFDKKMHQYSADFPIYIRSKPLKKEHVADVEQLGLLPNALKNNVQNLKTHFKYVHQTPIILPGCATAYDQLQARHELISKIL